MRSSQLLKRHLLVLSIAVTVAALVAACTAAPGRGGSAPGADDVPREQTLVLARDGSSIEDPNQMNPYGLGGLGRIRDVLNKTVYELLFYYNHNTGEEYPWLATAYEYNEDFTEATIQLRSGVKWSDGKPFTAEDVKYTLDLVADTPTFVFSAEMKDWVKTVEAVDDQTVRISLNRPNPRFVFTFFVENSEINLPVLPKHIWQDKDPEEFSNFDLDKGWPVGTGPYKAVAASAQRQVFDLREDWWAAKSGFAELPEVKRVMRIPGGDEAARARLFAEGEIDFGNAVPKGSFESAKERNPDLIAWNDTGPVWGTADACVYILGLNTKRYPFDNPDVRWAINHAIDRDKVIQTAFEGSTVPLVAPFSTFGGVAEYTDLIADRLPDVREHGADKVAARMAEAGFTRDGEGFWVDGDGKRIKMTISTTEGRRPLGPPVADMLREAGFDAIERYDDTDAVVDDIRAGNQDTWIEPHCGSAQEPYTTLVHFTSPYSAPIGKSTRYRWGNSRYENPAFDEIVSRMESIPPSADNPEYTKLFQDAMQIWIRDLPEIVLAEERHVWAFNTQVWTGWPSADNAYIAPYDVWGGFLLAILRLKPAGSDK
jgi:peptide/nickel transport system substrate-binding protein